MSFYSLYIVAYITFDSFIILLECIQINFSQEPQMFYIENCCF